MKKKAHQHKGTASQDITYKGVTKPLWEWCEKFNLKYYVVWQRLNRGWSVGKAFEQEPRTKEVKEVEPLSECECTIINPYKCRDCLYCTEPNSEGLGWCEKNKVSGGEMRVLIMGMACFKFEHKTQPLQWEVSNVKRLKNKQNENS